MLIPAFVLLTVYGHLGAALAVFLVAGATDAIDGLIARLTSHPTSLGAWLDPMADKLLLADDLRRAHGAANRVDEPRAALSSRHPRHQPRHRHRRRRRDRQPCDRTRERSGRPCWARLATATFIVANVVIMYFNWKMQKSPLVEAAIWLALVLTLASAGDYFFRLRRLINVAPP